jgi:HlyB family type I secretion system ABC transporter
MVEGLRRCGLRAKSRHLCWRQLFQFRSGGPIVLLFRDGGAGLLVGADAARNVVWLRNPRGADGESPVAVDELRLQQAWSGETLLIRRGCGLAMEEAPFDLRWMAKLVMGERRNLRDILIGSIAFSALAIIPSLLVMGIVDRVVVHRSLSTLALVALLLTIATIYDTLLGYGRREIAQVISTRLDARLNLHIFDRLLALPLDYFEKHQTGETTHRLMQVFKVREFLTGKLMGSFLDLITLFFLVPLLFWLDAVLAWITVGTSLVIMLVIVAFLPAMRRLYAHVVVSETRKGSFIVETVHGIRTVKSLAIERTRKEGWDERVADSSSCRLASGRLSNWMQTAVHPLEMFIQRGVIALGAYIAITGNPTVEVGGLIAFMLLGQRMAQPLVALAKLTQDFEELNAAVHEVATVLNNPTETKMMVNGMRPRLHGGISFSDVTFTYPGSKTPALERVSFEVPPGTMLGVVGRSGSGKSTITRLLQGINREYDGFLKIDGTDLREINLTHLRRSFGVVLQDNFLFRGTVRDNIIAGRPGLTSQDVVRAARLAGAEEFIERLHAGYETWIEEGSANLSGGQKQRLAIARALISDPRLMILDEATSALDPESESLVNANLRRIAQGRTMLIVSHRLSSLVDCDQILVMEKGRVVDLAPHEVLLQRCSIYRQLWMQQNRHTQGGTRHNVIKPVFVAGD